MGHAKRLVVSVGVRGVDTMHYRNSLLPGLAVFLLLCGPAGPAAAQQAGEEKLQIGKVTPTVRLHNERLEPVGMVQSSPEWVGQPILKNNHPESTQFVQIEYDGLASAGDKVAK